MPKKEKAYKNVIFTTEVIKEAFEILLATIPELSKKPCHQILEITLPSQEHWAHDSEDEFFADYRRGFNFAEYRKIDAGGVFDFLVDSLKKIYRFLE